MTQGLKPMLRWEVECLLRRTVGEFCAEYDADALWDDLVAHYEAEGRHYHTLLHIEEMFEFVLLRTEALGWGREDVDPVLFAVLWHDYIYDSAASKGANEERSAVHARTVLWEWSGCGGRVSERFAWRVHDLILSTVDHDPKTAEAKMLCDADLARFADPWEQFVVYNNDWLRREYAWVSDDAWAAGRAKVLDSFLMRDPLFHIATDLQPQAEQNLVRMLREIRAA